jgi:serine/threonine-protein kinase
MGKVRYSSPEQFAGPGASKLDRRSDLYSFGVLLYDLLTGHCPIGGKNLSQIIAAHLFEPPLAFSESDRQSRVPEGLRQVILKTLEKAPQDRPQTAEELASALAQFRPPTGDLAAELETVVAAARGQSAGEASKTAGSTQARLDQNFGVEGFVDAPLSEQSTVEMAVRLLENPLEPKAPVAAPPASKPPASRPPKTKPSSRELPTAVDLKNPISEAVSSIEQHISAGSLKTAARMIEFARLRFGDHPRLTALAAKVCAK